LSKLRKLASQTVLYGFTYFAGRLLNFFLTPVYTRIFSPEDFGTISLIFAYITFFKILFTYGMETGYFYFSNKQEESRPVAGTSFLSLVYSSFLFSGLIILFSPWLAKVIGYPGKSEYVIYSALILAFDTLMVIPFAYLRKHDKAARFAILNFANIAINILFNFIFLIACPYLAAHPGIPLLHSLAEMIYSPGHGVRYVFLANVLSSAVILIFVLPELRSASLKWSKEIWRSMLKYSWPLLILGFAGMINETLDRILLSTQLPGTIDERLVQVGIYSACYKISIFMTLAISSFRYAAEPFFFSQMKESNSKELFARVLKYFSFVTSFIFLGIMMYLPIIIHIIGKKFRSGLEVVPILLMANLFLGLFYYLSQWYKQTDKTIYGAMVSVAGALITLGVNYFFIPYYGYMASAWATFSCYFFMAVISFVLGQKHYPVKYETGRIIFYVASAFGLFLLSRFISGRPLGELGIGMYMLNTLIVILYVIVFIYLEKPAFIMKRVNQMRGRNA
jgi:O-antigen/teichoic acid export membrane protein